MPPQLRRFLFRKGGKRGGAKRARVPRLAPVRHMARRRGGWRRGRRGGGTAAIPILPTLIAVSPEMMVGLHAAVDVSRGMNAAVAGGLAVQRLKALYGAGPQIESAWEGTPLVYGVWPNITAKAVAAVAHLIARKSGLRGRISKRFTLL